MSLSAAVMIASSACLPPPLVGEERDGLYRLGLCWQTSHYWFGVDAPNGVVGVDAPLGVVGVDAPLGVVGVDAPLGVVGVDAPLSSRSSCSPESYPLSH